MEGDLVSLQDIFVFERTGLRRDGKVVRPLPRDGHPPAVQRTAAVVRRAACPVDMFEHVKLVA